MVGVNGLCLKLKGGYQELANLSRICGWRDGECSRFGDIQFALWVKGNPGSGSFFLISGIFFCVQRENLSPPTSDFP